jgi:hypothetical protein
MREKLNSNPLLQVAVIGVLVVGAGFLFLSTTGGGEAEPEAEPTEATVTVAGSGASGTATGSSPGEAVEGAINAAEATASVTPTSVPPLPPGTAAPPLPKAVTDAFDANRTLVFLFVRNSGIDDTLVKQAVARLGGLQEVSAFVVPARNIARYAAITQGVAVDRVPALVVVRPKDLGGEIPVASVQYGFQSVESVVQAVVDANYKGRTLDYHP